MKSWYSCLKNWREIDVTFFKKGKFRDLYHADIPDIVDLLDLAVEKISAPSSFPTQPTCMYNLERGSN